MRKELITVGKKLYWAVDERPIDKCFVVPIIVTEMFEDHYIAIDTDVNSSLWLEYDEPNEYSSTAVFETEIQAKNWLRTR